MYIDKTLLDDDYKASGTGAEELVQVLTELRDNTIMFNVGPTNLEVCSIINSDKKGTLVCIKHDPLSAIPPEDIVVSGYGKNVLYNLSYEKMKSRDFTPQMITDMKNVGYFFLYEEEPRVMVIIPSKKLMATFCRQLGIGKLSDGQNALRDAYIANLLWQADDFLLKCRARNGIAKGLAAFTGKYVESDYLTSVNLLLDTLTTYTPAIRDWVVTNTCLKVDFIFPGITTRINKTKISGGVRLTISDIGDAGYKMENIIYVSGGVIPTGKGKSCTHRNNEYKKIAKKYSESCIAQFKEVFEQLEKKEPLNNKVNILQLLEKIGLQSVLGKKRMVTLLSQIEKSEIPDFATKTDVCLFAWKLQGKYANRYSEDFSERIGRLLFSVYQEVK